MANNTNDQLQFGNHSYTAEELKQQYELDDVQILRNKKNGNVSIGMLPRGKKWNDSDAVLFGAVSRSIDWTKPIVFKECWHSDEDPEQDEPFIMAMNPGEHSFFDYFEVVQGNDSPAVANSNIPF